MSMTGQRTTLALSDQESVEIEVTPDPDHYRRVDLLGPDGRRWEYGVNNDREAELLVSYDSTGTPTPLPEPHWVPDALRHIGLRGVDA